MIPSDARIINATLLFSDNFTTRFMQSADVFEPFKVRIMPPVKAAVVNDFGQKNVEVILKQREGQAYALVAAVTKDFHWFDPKVKVVSFGTHWCTLEEYFGMSVF